MRPADDRLTEATEHSCLRVSAILLRSVGHADMAGMAGIAWWLRSYLTMRHGRHGLSWLGWNLTASRTARWYLIY